MTGTPLAQWQRVWRRMVDVNLLGAADLSWAVAAHLVERGAAGATRQRRLPGRVPRRNRTSPPTGRPRRQLHALGQSLAVALAPHGITVTSVAPGFIATERQAAKLSGPEGERLRAESPFGRVGTPEEVAATVRFLALPGRGLGLGDRRRPQRGLLPAHLRAGLRRSAAPAAAKPPR
ncbi:SDR family NAD(P)-dependent oxidoreductase [Streptomyces sp. PG2]